MPAQSAVGALAGETARAINRDSSARGERACDTTGWCQIETNPLTAIVRDGRDGDSLLD